MDIRIRLSCWQAAYCFGISGRYSDIIWAYYIIAKKHMDSGENPAFKLDFNLLNLPETIDCLN